MFKTWPCEQSTKGVPTGGWTVTQVAAAATGPASCPPRALDASARIAARAMTLSTSSLPYVSTIRSLSEKDASFDRLTAARGDEAAATQSKQPTAAPAAIPPATLTN